MPLESAALDPRRKTELYGVDGMRGNAGLTPASTAPVAVVICNPWARSVEMGA